VLKRHEQFLDAIQADFLDDGYHWRLTAPLTLEDIWFDTITAPAGFVTDLGSIPRIFWNLLPPIGPASKAFVIHDWLYATQTCTREDADDILLRAMQASNVHWAAIWLIYWGVRMGGMFAWISDAKSLYKNPN
jgi:hypothetical protein